MFYALQNDNVTFFYFEREVNCAEAQIFLNPRYKSEINFRNIIGNGKVKGE